MSRARTIEQIDADLVKIESQIVAPDSVTSTDGGVNFRRMRDLLTAKQALLAERDTVETGQATATIGRFYTGEGL